MNDNRGFLFPRYDSINFCIAFLLAWISLTSLLGAIYEDGMNNQPIFKILQLCYLGAIFNAIPAVFRGKYKNTIFIFLLFYFLIYFISSAFCDDEEFEGQVFRTLYLWCWPYFIMAFKIKDFGHLFKILKIVGYLAIACELLRLLSFSVVSLGYSQETGYGALIPLAVFTLSYVRERKLYYLVPITISFAIILMSGSRGPLLCGVLLFLFVFIIQHGISSKAVFTSFIVFLIFLVYKVYQYEILTWVLDFFTQISVSTRNIEKLLNNDLATDDIRELLRNTSFQYALDHPFWSTGLLNDRIFLYKYSFITSPTATVYGSYSHFFFAEVLMQFGLIPGCLLVFFLFQKLWTRIFKWTSVDEQNLFIISVTVGLFPLLVSRSWFTFPLFYFLLGLLFSAKSKKQCQNL